MKSVLVKPLSRVRTIPESKRASKIQKRAERMPGEFIAKELLRKDGKRKGNLASAISKGDNLGK